MRNCFDFPPFIWIQAHWWDIFMAHFRKIKFILKQNLWWFVNLIEIFSFIKIMKLILKKISRISRKKSQFSKIKIKSTYFSNLQLYAYVLMLLRTKLREKILSSQQILFTSRNQKGFREISSIYCDYFRLFHTKIHSKCIQCLPEQMLWPLIQWAF